MKTFSIVATLTSTVEDTISATTDKEAAEKFKSNFKNHLYDDKKRGESIGEIKAAEV